MCVAFLACNTLKNFKLVIAHNRDEFYERPAKAADFWVNQPDLFAGVDVKGGGTWLGISTRGKVAFVTNFRNGSPQIGKVSRGLIVTDYFRSALSSAAYVDALKANHANYAPYSIVLGTHELLQFYSTESADVQNISPGYHGISNNLLDVPWPKVRRGREKFIQVCEAHASPTAIVSALLDLLSDATQAEDSLLPDTGVGVDLERQLSSIFVRMPIYGTRASTIILIDHSNVVTVVERTYSVEKRILSEVTRTFAIQGGAS